MSAGAAEHDITFGDHTYKVTFSGDSWGVLRMLKQPIRNKRWECLSCGSASFGHMQNVQASNSSSVCLRTSPYPQAHARRHLYHGAGKKTSCDHCDNAGVVPKGSGLSDEAFETELKQFLGSNCKRAKTCISNALIPEDIGASPKFETY